jgi:sugar lactone lactonase YvrE
MEIDHDGGAFQPLPSRVLTTWAPGTSLENIAVRNDGMIAVSIQSEGEIEEIDPGDWKARRVAKLPKPIAGIVYDAFKNLWIASGVPHQPPGMVWRLSKDGELALWCGIEDAELLNGMCLTPDGSGLLIAESFTGRIHWVNMLEPQTRVWLDEPQLKPSSGTRTPGANGIRIWQDKAFISVSERNTLLEIGLSATGEAGPMRALSEHLRVDDFAIDPEGRFYLCTHQNNSVVRLSADGRERVTIGGPEQGLVGATAAAFGRGGADAETLYVVTNGGRHKLYEGHMQDAKLVAIDTKAK